MSARSFSSSLEDGLFSSAFGDVLAARAAAIDLLASSASVNDPLATMVLTAVLIQAVLEQGGDVRRWDAQQLCEAFLAADGPAPRLGRSSSLFVRYTAEEAGRCEADDRHRLLGRLVGAVLGQGPADPPERRHGGSSGAISQNRD